MWVWTVTLDLSKHLFGVRKECIRAQSRADGYSPLVSTKPTRTFTQCWLIVRVELWQSLMPITPWNMELSHQIFAENKAFVEDLLEAGLEPLPAKSQCYISEILWDAEWDGL